MNYKSAQVVDLLIEAGANPELVLGIKGIAALRYYSGRETFKRRIRKAIKRHDYYADKIDYGAELALGI